MDNIYFQNIILTSGEFEEEKSYWLEKLKGEAALSVFPLDYTRIGMDNYTGAVLKHEFSYDVSQKLIAISNESKYTLYIILLSCVKYLLSVYTQNNTTIVGMPLFFQDSDENHFKNIVALKDIIGSEDTYKDFLIQVRNTVVEADKNQNYPYTAIAELLGMTPSDNKLLLSNIIVMMKGIHDRSIVEEIITDNVFSFDTDLEGIKLTLEYNALLFSEKTMKQIVRHLENIMNTVANNPDVKLSEVSLMDESEIKQLLDDMNSTRADYPSEKTIHQIFEEQVQKTPNNIALSFDGNEITYKELDMQANQLANLLTAEHDMVPDKLVGILLEKSNYTVIAALAVLKAGGAYVPIDPDYPEMRIKTIINDASIEVVISNKNHIRLLNRLQWECKTFKAYICMDSVNVYKESEELKSELMNSEIWEYIGENASNDIQGGAWVSSYTGEDLKEEEMDEYSENVLKKLMPYLNSNTRVLEIGCASGLSMWKIAPYAGYYFGTDISRVIIDKNRQRVVRDNIKNIRLESVPAHDIYKIDENDFDVVIINSVVQCFHGHNYLRDVISKVFDLLKDTGIVFIGDIMDQNMKEALINSLKEFKDKNRGKGYRTKTDWSVELFISRDFFDDLMFDFHQIKSVAFSNKLYTIENELTRFRYDALLNVDKNNKFSFSERRRHKYQQGLDSINKYGTTPVKAGGVPENLAYIIYTSGTTGIPKGAMIKHKNVVRLMVNEKSLFDFNEEDIWTMFHSFCFDFSVWEMYGALLFGGKLVIVPKTMARDTREYLSLLKKEGVTVLNQTPSAFYNLMNEEMECTERQLKIRCVIFGGEALKLSMLQPWMERYPGTELINMYGITETTVHVTFKRISKYDTESNISNIGKPIPTTTAYIMDKNMKLLPPGVAGELLVGGDGVGRGYLNKNELTAEKFVPNPYNKHEILYRSGDLVRRLHNGELEYLGRLDHQVKIRGFRIELGEIEAVLREHSFIKDALVLQQEDKSGDRYLAAYIVADKRHFEVYDGKLRYKLPNNMAIAHLNKNETDFMYREIFEDKNYIGHGIRIKELDCIFDIGANIGMFTMFVNQIYDNLKVYSFEPIPDIYDVLEVNARLYGNNTTTFNMGLSVESSMVEFTYYPKVSVMSGCYADEEHDSSIFANTMIDREHMTESEIEDISRYGDELVDGRFDARKVVCQLKTLSEVIKENYVEKIDLLKIDVEKSELDVLKGIDSDDWKKIRQIVIEVFDEGNRLSKVRALLEKQGFQVLVQENSVFENGGLYTVFAASKQHGYTLEQKRNPPDYNVKIHEDNILSTDAIRSFIKASLPEYMVPAYFAYIDRLPLTPNGKVDIKALPTDLGANLKNMYKEPHNEIERRLVDIWKKILGLERIGINDNFFEIGGHSLKATILVSQIYRIFDVDVPLRQVFVSQTIKGLAEYIKEAGVSIYTPIPAVEKNRYYPLSSSQKRVFIVEQYRGINTSYNMPFAIMVTGPLEKDLLEDAFVKIVNRHETLRTSSHFIEGEAVQVIHDDVKFRIDFTEACENEVRKIVKGFIKPFVLEEAPLLRALLIKLSPVRHILLIDMHHIISDGTSLGLFVKEFINLYSGKSVPKLKIQYKDYAQWQNKMLESSLMKRQEEFWLNMFSGEIKPLNLPTDYPRPAMQSFRGDNHNFSINEELTSSLKRICVETGATMYMVLLAIYNIFLSKCTGQNDITVASGTAGRLHPDVENLIGMFINTLSIRNFPDADKTFKEFLNEVKDRSIQAFENQGYQFEVLLEKLHVERSLSRKPLQDTMFVYQNMDLPQIKIEGLEFSPYDITYKMSKVDLSLYSAEFDDGIHFSFEYCTDLFNPQTIAMFSRYYLRIIESVIGNIGIKIQDIDVIDQSEKESLVSSIISSYKKDTTIEFDF